MKLSCSPATPEDLLALRLRPEDEHEVSLFGLEDPMAFLAPSVDPASSVAIRDPSGDLVAVGGVTCPAPGQLSPWLLCSSLVSRHKRDMWALLRQSFAPLRSRADEGVFVWNIIGKDSVQARRLVQYLGFVIKPLEGPFDLFHLPERPCV